MNIIDKYHEIITEHRNIKTLGEKLYHKYINQTNDEYPNWDGYEILCNHIGDNFEQHHIVSIDYTSKLRLHIDNEYPIINWDYYNKYRELETTIKDCENQKLIDFYNEVELVLNRELDSIKNYFERYEQFLQNILDNGISSLNVDENKLNEQLSIRSSSLLNEIESALEIENVVQYIFNHTKINIELSIENYSIPKKQSLLSFYNTYTNQEIINTLRRAVSAQDKMKTIETELVEEYEKRALRYINIFKQSYMDYVNDYEELYNYLIMYYSDFTVDDNYGIIPKEDGVYFTLDIYTYLVKNDVTRLGLELDYYAIKNDDLDKRYSHLDDLSAFLDRYDRAIEDIRDRFYF